METFGAPALHKKFGFKPDRLVLLVKELPDTGN